jgi:hypothetical protein
MPSRIGRETQAGRTQWRARFTFNGTMKCLGLFATKEDAAYAIHYAYEYLAEERKWAGKWRSFADFEPENIAEPIVQVRVQVRKQIRRLLRKAAQC